MVDLSTIEPPGPISGEAARRAAEAQLRRGEYHQHDPNVVNRVLDWIGRRLTSVVSGTQSGSATLLLLALLAGLVIFAIWRAGRPRRAARAKRAAPDPLAANAAVDHRQVALQLEQQGHYAEAQREWLRAAIATIEERGILDPRPGRTGARVAREAGAVLPSIADDLNGAIDAFEQVWFGRRIATAADAAQAHRVADAVRSARIETSLAPAGYAAPR